MTPRTMEREGALEVGLAADDQVRWAAVELRAVVEEARLRLDLAPLAAIAFGRCAAAATLLLRLASKAPRRLTLQVSGDGPLGRVLVEVRADGGVRGLVANPHATGVEGETDFRLGPALGTGLLTVTRTVSDGSSYQSQVELVSGEVAKDVAHFLALSEQRRSAVLLGVHADGSGILAAGGLIIEAMPGADDDVVRTLEARVAEVESISRLLGTSGLAGSVGSVLGELDPEAIDRRSIRFRCRCSRERLGEQLEGIPRQQLEELLDDAGKLAAECAYCGHVYHFELEEIVASQLH